MWKRLISRNRLVFVTYDLTGIISYSNTVTGGRFGRKTGALNVEIGSTFQTDVSPL